MKIRKLGFAVNIYKKDIDHILMKIIDLVPDDVEIVGTEEILEIVSPGVVDIVDSYEDCDVVVSLGGDGTLLRAARLVEKDEIPVMGVKIRSLGFLTEDNPEGAVESLFRGEYIIQDRMRLEVSFTSRDKADKRYSALNDIVIHGAGLSRVIHLRTSLDGTTVGEYLADGVIIATPTGSTAYSLAAGGPILNPVTMQSMIITPLCPHSLSVRPMVVNSTESLEIEVVEKDQDTMLTIDGQKVSILDTGERISVRISDKVTRLVTRNNYNFYELVRKKLRWGGVLRKH